MALPYTGFDGNVLAPRPAMDVWITNAVKVSGLKNLGSWMIRDQKSSKTVNHKERPSVHGTGRAVDLGWTGIKNGRAKALDLINLLVMNDDLLGVELILDYNFLPYGRGYKSDRGKWQNYQKPTIAGAPSGKWIHVEIAPGLVESLRATNLAWNLLTAPKAL